MKNRSNISDSGNIIVNKIKDGLQISKEESIQIREEIDELIPKKELKNTRDDLRLPIPPVSRPTVKRSYVHHMLKEKYSFIPHSGPVLRIEWINVGEDVINSFWSMPELFPLILAIYSDKMALDKRISYQEIKGKYVENEAHRIYVELQIQSDVMESVGEIYGLRVALNSMKNFCYEGVKIVNVLVTQSFTTDYDKAFKSLCTHKYT